MAANLSNTDAYVLTEDFETIKILDDYSSFIWTDRYWEAGDFEIKLPASVLTLSQFAVDYYIVKGDSEHVMMVSDIEVNSDTETQSFLIVKGYSLERALLDRRIIKKQTQLDGDLQNGIKRLLNENAINPSDANRKIPGLEFKSVDDKEIADLKVTAQFTGDNLYDAIQKLCQEAEIGFKITMPEDGRYVFELYTGSNRTYDQSENPFIIFSPNYENLMNSSSIQNWDNYRNYALVGGEGEGDQRKFADVYVDDQQRSGLDLRELFVDARDLQSKVDDKQLTDEEYRNTLIQRGKEDLADYDTTTVFDGEAETSRSFQYQKDYFLGDIVQIEDEFGRGFTSRITEFIYSHDDSEKNSYPSFEVID